MAFQTPARSVPAPGPARVSCEPSSGTPWARARQRAVENASSVYRPDSDVSRLNREGLVDDPSPHLVTLLRYAQTLSCDTDGAYDVTVQPLWDLWAAAFARGERPGPAALRDMVSRVDWRGVSVGPNKITLDRRAWP